MIASSQSLASIRTQVRPFIKKTLLDQTQAHLILEIVKNSTSRGHNYRGAALLWWYANRGNIGSELNWGRVNIRVVSTFQALMGIPVLIL